MDKEDTRFLLTSFREKQAQTTHEYKGFTREIENYGWIIMKTETDIVKIYTPELALIFYSEELPALNMDTQKKTKINGWDYFKTYIEAYNEGGKYFDIEYAISPNTLYGVNAERYVMDIHLNFFHNKHKGLTKGWQHVKEQYPFIITHKIIKEFGYYSGIVSKVEEMVKKYPILFQNFDKIKHTLPPQQTKIKPLKSFIEFLDLQKEIDRNDFADELKKLFKKHSPKQYAIMTILLFENGIIKLNERERVMFYKAWYLYINQALPKNNNFDTINRHLKRDKEKGFLLKINDYDVDNVNLTKEFELLIKQYKIK